MNSRDPSSKPRTAPWATVGIILLLAVDILPLVGYPRSAGWLVHELSGTEFASMFSDVRSAFCTTGVLGWLFYPVLCLPGVGAALLGLSSGRRRMALLWALAPLAWFTVCFVILLETIGEGL